MFDFPVKQRKAVIEEMSVEQKEKINVCNSIKIDGLAVPDYTVAF